MAIPLDDRTEWLEADGLGGFASGTATRVRTRRYHAVLLAAANPPTERFVLVNGFEAWVETAAGTYPLSSQKYMPGIVHPPALLSIASFEPEPWPRWTYRLEDGTEVESELFVPRGAAMAALAWRVVKGSRECRLFVRPLISGRDFHALHHENGAFRFDAEVRGECVGWRPYDGVPAILARGNGAYTHSAEWYRGFLYDEERERGLDHVEDLASPGVFRWEIKSEGVASKSGRPRLRWHGEAVLMLAADGIGEAGGGAAGVLRGTESAATLIEELRERERKRRAAFRSPLERSGDSYIVKRGGGKTIVAGYPWFADWGRDTFISLRGLCLATGRHDEAGAILREWAPFVSEGMLPNRFPDRGSEPEYNAVDASLWYVVAVGEYLDAMGKAGQRVGAGERRTLEGAVAAIVSRYAAGTRYGIRQDDDGLLAAGVAGVQLTWMDAKCGDWVVTARIGKPVEVQALWVNALAVAGRFDARWARESERASEAFRERFWNESRACLFDVVDADHVRGRDDVRIRPNQLLAIGGLPVALLEGPRARKVVDMAEVRLLTPMGARSLAPGEPGFVPRYEGGPIQRDAAYHQGTVWPWLMGAFVEAWVRVRGSTDAAKREARRRFLDPLLAHLDEAGAGGVGHISEVADAERPHAPRGCPFQAWSVAEAIRLDRIVLAIGASNGRTAGARPGRGTTRAGTKSTD